MTKETKTSQDRCRPFAHKAGGLFLSHFSKDTAEAEWSY